MKRKTRERYTAIEPTSAVVALSYGSRDKKKIDAHKPHSHKPALCASANQRVIMEIVSSD